MNKNNRGLTAEQVDRLLLWLQNYGKDDEDKYAGVTLDSRERLMQRTIIKWIETLRNQTKI